MYQIKRTEKIRDTLELRSEDGTTGATLEFVVDIDAIAGELRRNLTDITTAEQSLKKAANDRDYSTAYEQYGKAVSGIIAVCFGGENARCIVDFFEGNYIEMSVAIVPYIYDVILPRVNECLNRRREQLRGIYRKGKKLR